METKLCWREEVRRVACVDNLYAFTPAKTIQYNCPHRVLDNINWNRACFEFNLLHLYMSINASNSLLAGSTACWSLRPTAVRETRRKFIPKGEQDTGDKKQDRAGKDPALFAVPCSLFPVPSVAHCGVRASAAAAALHLPRNLDNASAGCLDL